MLQGLRNAIPILVLLAVGFAAPLLAVIAFSFMPERTFGLFQTPTLQNYRTIFQSTSYISFLWSLSLAVATTVILALICYPVAYGLVHLVGTVGDGADAALHHPAVCVGECPLYGWVLFFIKNGVLLGTLKSLFGIESRACCSRCRRSFSAWSMSICLSCSSR